MGLVVVAMLAVGRVLWEREADARCRGHLRAWAERKGYVLDTVTRRWVSLRFRYRRAQRVYEVVVHDASGRRLAGDAKVGSWLFGAVGDNVVVDWR